MKKLRFVQEFVRSKYYDYLAWRQMRHIRHLKKKHGYKDNWELNFGKKLGKRLKKIYE